MSPLSPPLRKRLRLGSDRENKEQDRKDGAVKYPPMETGINTASSSSDDSEDADIINRITRRESLKKRMKPKKKLTKKEKRLKAESRSAARNKGLYYYLFYLLACGVVTHRFL